MAYAELVELGCAQQAEAGLNWVAVGCVPWLGLARAQLDFNLKLLGAGCLGLSQASRSSTLPERRNTTHGLVWFAMACPEGEVRCAFGKASDIKHRYTALVDLMGMNAHVSPEALESTAMLSFIVTRTRA